MSNTQYAFLEKDKVPTQQQWQQAIDDLGFDFKIQIDPELAPFEDEGFSPCIWGETDDDVGFEIFYEPAEDVHEGDEDVLSMIGARDYSISFCWYGSMKDCAAVMVASCALAKSFDAVISYEGEDSEPLEKLISDTQSIIKEALQ